MSHALSQSHSWLLAFQINPLSHIPFSFNTLHSHLHLSLFQCCLLLQVLASNQHWHFQVSWQSMCFVSLVLDIRLKILILMFLTTSGAPTFADGSLILLLLPLHLFTLKHYKDKIKVHYCWYLFFLFLFYTLDYSLKHILTNLYLINYNKKNVIGKPNSQGGSLHLTMQVEQANSHNAQLVHFGHCIFTGVVLKWYNLLTRLCNLVTMHFP